MKKPSRSESVIQKHIVARLRAAGHIVVVCGTRARGPRGFSPVTPGCPDLFVWSPGRWAWIGIEVKRPDADATTRMKQLDHLLAGRTYLATSAEDALDIMRTTA